MYDCQDLTRVRRRGIILASTLFFILVLGMLARAVLLQGPLRLQQAEQGQRDLGMRHVAEAGVVYAQTRLRDDRNWRGNGTGLVVDLPHLKVREDAGNVLGWIRENTGEVAQFRIRFNYQDGAVLHTDNLADPAPRNLVPNPFVSCNNLRGSADVQVPQADQGTWSVSATPPATTLAPRGSVLLFVEARTGQGLGFTQDPSDSGQGRINSRVLKVLLAESLIASTSGASLMAGGNVSIESDTGAQVAVVGTATPPMLRSKRGISVTDTAGAATQSLTMSGQVGRDPSAGLRANIVGNISVSDEHVGDSKDLYNLRWSDVVQADANPASTSAVQIPGGVYIFQPSDNNFHYYDMTLDAYKALPSPKPAGVTLSHDFSEVRSSTNLSNVPDGLNVTVQSNTVTAPPTTNVTQTTVVGNTTVVNVTNTTVVSTSTQPVMQITRDLRVLKSPGGVSDIVVAPVDGRRLHSQDAGKYVLGSLAPGEYTGDVGIDIKNSLVSTSGDMILLCNLQSANGTLTAEGKGVVAASSVSVRRLDVTITNNTNSTGGGNSSNSSVTNSSSNVTMGSPVTQALSVYMKKDLTLSTYIPLPGAGINSTFSSGGDYFGSLDLQGLFYTWGDASIYGANVGGSGTAGPFALRGLFVAYGANPESAAPGSWGKGNVDIRAASVGLTYDASKLGGLLSEADLLRNTGITRLSYGFLR